MASSSSTTTPPDEPNEPRDGAPSISHISRETPGRLSVRERDKSMKTHLNKFLNKYYSGLGRGAPDALLPTDITNDMVGKWASYLVNEATLHCKLHCKEGARSLSWQTTVTTYFSSFKTFYLYKFYYLDHPPAALDDKKFTKINKIILRKMWVFLFLR